MPLHRKDQQKPKLLTSSLWKVVTFFGIKHVMRTNNGKVMDEKRKKWECRNVTSFFYRNFILIELQFMFTTKSVSTLSEEKAKNL